MPSHYPKELRERATRLALEARQDPATKQGAIDRVATQLGVNSNTLYSWVKQAEKQHRTHPTDTTPQLSDAERIKQLEQENFELRRANTILKQASAFFAVFKLNRP